MSTKPTNGADLQHKGDTDGKKSFVVFLVVIVISVFSLFVIAIGIQASEARYYDKIRPLPSPWDFNYAILFEAKKQLLEECSEVISIGDSSGLPLNPKIISAVTGRSFTNLNLYASIGFIGLLKQVEYLKQQGCRPDKIIVYLAPSVILYDHSRPGLVFEKFFTVLQFGTVFEAGAILVNNIKLFPRIFRYSFKTWIRYLASRIFETDFGGSAKSLFQRHDIWTTTESETHRRIQVIVSVKGYLPFEKSSPSKSVCPVTVRADGSLNDFSEFLEGLEKFYDRKRYIIMMAALPACTTNFDTIMKNVGGVYDVKPIKANSAWFSSSIHTTRKGATFISKRVAEVLLSQDNNLK